MNETTDEVTLGMDPELLRVSCEAVAGAARPSLVKALPIRSREDMPAYLRTRIEEHLDLAVIAPWWEAFGTACVKSLMDLREVDQPLASHIIGASVQAHVSARQDLDSGSVIRLGEGALTWMAGLFSGCS